MTRKQRSGKAWKKWRGLICAHAESGQTITAFCQERGLSRPSFFAWKKRLSQAAPSRGTAAIEVRLRNGRSLLLASGFDATHVRSLLAVLDTQESEA
jgi:hypothetical protein